MTETSFLSDVATHETGERFRAAAAAAAAALGLDRIPETSAALAGGAEAIGVPATLAAAIPVAGEVTGDLLLITTAELDPALDDRALGGLTALSPRVRALRAAADAVGLRHGDAVEADPADLSADLCVVLTVDGRPVGALAMRQRRPAAPEAEPASASPEAAPAGVPAQPTAPAPAPAAAPRPASIVGGGAPAAAGPLATRLEQITHVEMEVTVEIGRTRMSVGSLLGLVPGQVVELDRPAGAPVDLFVNGTLLARGEIVVVDEDFGFRVTDIVNEV
jgi:flagellar motor switch protein FliN/FliY